MAAGAVRVGNTVAAAVANTRVLESVEANIAVIAGATLAAVAALAFTYPRGIAYPIGAIATWLAAAIFYNGMKLHRRRRRTGSATMNTRRAEQSSAVPPVQENPRAPDN
jgi:cardiolipin synthase